MANYQFAVYQETDGLWAYRENGIGLSGPWDTDFPTREQAERAAQQFADRMKKGDQIELIIRERMEVLVKEWTDQVVSEFGTDRQDVLLDIRYGVEATLDKLCPAT